MDASPQMLRVAQAHSPQAITYLHWDLAQPGGGLPNAHTENYDIVVSMHCFDWIRPIEQVLAQLARALKPRGLMIFAVFPERHIVDSLRIRDLFEDFDFSEQPPTGVANFDGIRVPVYVRSPGFYDGLFARMNFDKVLEYYPPFPRVFLEQYAWRGSLEPEMMILAYQKRERPAG